MALIRVDWNPTEKKIRQFGGLLMLFALFVAAMAWRKGNAQAAWAIGTIGVVLGAVSAAWPSFGRRIYLAWTAVSFVIGTVVSTILLALLYFGIVTPIALVMRLTGRDALRLRGDGGSFWVPLSIPEDKEYFERLY